jgi:hypothetical protein
MNGMVRRLTKLLFATVMTFAFVGAGVAHRVPSGVAAPAITGAEGHDHSRAGMMVAHGQQAASAKPAVGSSIGRV